MPQVFSNDMVAHVWAQQSQDEGRSYNGQFYFRGPNLYSYGTHYLAGMFVAVGGLVFINGDSISMTTNRHVSRAWNAARHLSPWRIMRLTDIAPYLRDAAQDRATDGDRARLLTYLGETWQYYGPESEAAAWIYRKAGKRGTWAAYRAKLEAAKRKADAVNAARLKAADLSRGRRFAALTWPVVAGDAWIEAGKYRQQNLRDTCKQYRDSRLATPRAHKRVRATLWRYETGLRLILAKAEADTDRHGNPGNRTKARGHLARLRQLREGRLNVPGYDGPHGLAALTASLALPSGAGWRFLVQSLNGLAAHVHMPPAMREAMQRIHDAADALATKREGEAEQRSQISHARTWTLTDLATFNRGRRVIRKAQASGAWSGLTPVDPVTGGSYAPMTAQAKARAIDSILYCVPDGPFGGTCRGFDLSPALAERARAIGVRARAIAAELEPVREALTAEIEAELTARREREAAERARIHAVSDAERIGGWQAGELSRSAIDLMPGGPFLRALDPAIDGCTVKAGTLETSQGATVPLRHAFRVFQFAAICRAERKAWKPDGAWGPRHIRVGHFTLDRIDSTGDFVAGCHSISWAEVERLATRLGVAGCLATLPEVTAELAGESVT